ncbi:hypothetical protein cce_2048 [Crocosphaera subtropica ATCC 51142]|uniref:Uncharacterized protein n=1 Tax=Crocosphaera subtropica (strain ATCC 51142 / BH68) TaxID=43989 RepID=B1X1G9_CROS5|nr:hypothetical protein cce_2048 [Crocosphaera subtropica ATCC 51142]
MWSFLSNPINFLFIYCILQKQILERSLNQLIL